MIVKPSLATPLSCLDYVRILREAGWPEDRCRVLLASNDDAEALVTDPRVAFFSFIGSARVGWSLRSKLAAGTRCALEHGGVAPVIVAEDADLELAAQAITKGGFYHAGQVCVSVQRVFVVGTVADQLAEKLVAAASKLKTGDPAHPETDVGPLIAEREVQRVGTWVDAAREAGAALLCGGEPVGTTCYAPTILLDPPDSSEIARQEVFGPVIALFRCASLGDAIARANAVEASFQAAVFARDLDTALEVSDRLNGSAVMVNDHTAFRVDWMPFAGLGPSGLGTGGIPGTLDDMTIEKMTVIRRQTPAALSATP
nr:aldehyde dehydrogenase family protein [Pacificoceanicola onchidii]